MVEWKLWLLHWFTDVVLEHFHSKVVEATIRTLQNCSWLRLVDQLPLTFGMSCVVSAAVNDTKG
jgi:hypothetical protein